MGGFTNLFQRCLDSGRYQVWKTSTIIPIPKVALTLLVMKIFVSFSILNLILKDMTLGMIDGKLDPLQFAYQAGKGVEDAKCFILEECFSF